MRAQIVTAGQASDAVTYFPPSRVAGTLPYLDVRARYVGESVYLRPRETSWVISASTQQEITSWAASRQSCERLYTGGSYHAGGERLGKPLELVYNHELPEMTFDAIWGSNQSLSHLCTPDAYLEGQSELARIVALHLTEVIWLGERVDTWTDGRSRKSDGRWYWGKTHRTSSTHAVVGCADVVLFDPSSMTYSGPVLKSVPLCFINGTGLSVSLEEAFKGALAQLFKQARDEPVELDELEESKQSSTRCEMPSMLQSLSRLLSPS